MAEEIEPNRDSSSESRSRKKSKNPLPSLASGDSRGNSHSSGGPVIDRDDDNENWGGYQAGFDSVSKRSGSLASTATLTSNENSFSHSHSHSGRSPRIGSSYSKSPKHSPRPGCLKKTSSDYRLSAGRTARQIASLPLASEEDDRRLDKSDRRFSGDRGSKSKEGQPVDGNGLYYQPSKASLHASNINVPTKKPQRIKNRSNSKGPILRQKSYGENSSSSLNTGEGSSSARGSSGKRSKSCEPQDIISGAHGRGHSREPPHPCTKSKKKLSPTVSRNRKHGPTRSSAQSNAKVHESWSRQEPAETKEGRRKNQTSKSKSSQKKKETNEEHSSMITFLEDVSTKKSNYDRSGGLFKKSSSARAVKRNSSGANTFPDRRERRSSAPAKALTAFHNYKKAMLPPEFDYDDDEDEPKSLPPLSQPPKEKILLDVSELAALEIIRLGKDNSLKLDLYDLLKHLRQDQLEKSGRNR